MAVAHDLPEEVDRVAGKLIAVEAVVVQILAPLLEPVQPGLAGEVIQLIRAGLNVPTLNEFQKLAAEEYLQSFADDVEARVRAKIGSRR
jgi:hypothetical protein